MRKRIAIIDKDKCHPINCGNYLCMKLCPVNRTGTECIVKNELNNKVKIDEKLCTGCGICANRCPYHAIQIINLPEQLKKEPVHKYGENSFELYSLPNPLFNKVTGIIGRNGIGKSTAIKIIAGIVTANLGQWDKEADFKDLIAYFKGTEMQSFLEKLSKGEIKLSYKPQQVELIPKQIKGKVKELLEKVDETGRFDEVVKVLQLEKFLETDINKISGGELQRVAIAATVLKKANLYLFDEPSSYLDIKQRINVSNFIRSLANEETAVMVIEHDLIILDFMTQMLNIMYGKEGAYGVVSGIKSTREGINAFLEGYLKEENVMFRKDKIKFESLNLNKETTKTELISWENINKKLGNFELSTKKGILYENEIVGILGENGIGKTTFIQILAGVLKQDSGNLNNEVRVSYKPQYLHSDSEELVMQYLHQANKSYKIQLIDPLNLEELFMKKLNQLSGGELQRVEIARCLAEEAELFLMDEPSAYLDVEQRLLISKVIKNVTNEREITVMIIDHDLMFLDYVSTRLAVFSGEPGIKGLLEGPFEMVEGMNKFLEDLNITLRRDLNSNRPRINNPNSVKDREQRKENKYYY
jgi:ATP-binding cassette, sub-family E, member 1